MIIKIKSALEHDFDKTDIIKIEDLMGEKSTIIIRNSKKIGKVNKAILEGLPIDLKKREDAYYKANDKISILESRGFKVDTKGKKMAKGKVYQIDDTDESENYKVYDILELLDIDALLFFCHGCYLEGKGCISGF
jgi:hypothetical protein